MDYDIRHWHFQMKNHHSTRQGLHHKSSGIGLLEAIDESDILDWEDPTDSDGNGISGLANRIPDPVTGDIRLGRLGWKASTIRIRVAEHQTIVDESRSEWRYGCDDINESHHLIASSEQ